VLTITNYIYVIGPPVLVVSPGNLDFGLNPTNAMVQSSFIVSNAGASTLTGSAALPAGVFSIASGADFAVDPAGQTNLLIAFTPGGSGAFSNFVVFTSNGGDSSNGVSGRAISEPTLILSPSGAAQFDFSFLTLSGFTYTIEYKDFLTDPLWLPLQTNLGNGNTMFITNSLATPQQRFYRLLVQ
jgi:hypothetical protein